MKTSVKSPGPRETLGTASPSEFVILKSHCPYAEFLSVFSFNVEGFCSSHHDAASKSVSLLVNRALKSNTGLSWPGAQSATFMCPRGVPSQSCETSPLIPYVLWIVNETVVVVEALPPLITSISISPMSSSSLSRLGFTPRIRTLVLCLSRRGVWKVPSPSS